MEGRSILSTVLAPGPELNLAEAVRRLVAVFGGVGLDLINPWDAA